MRIVDSHPFAVRLERSVPACHIAACNAPADSVYDRALETLLNLALALLPTADTAARHTTTINASITAYSTAVGPSSDTRNFFTLFANFVIVKTPHVGARIRASDVTAECYPPTHKYSATQS